MCFAKRRIVSLDHRSYCFVIERKHIRVVENLNNPSGWTCTKVYYAYNTCDVKICDIDIQNLKKKKVPTSKMIRHITISGEKN